MTRYPCASADLEMQLPNGDTRVSRQLCTSAFFSQHYLEMRSCVLFSPLQDVLVVFIRWVAEHFNLCFSITL